MHIHCVSSLSDDDEAVLAPVIVAMLAAFFDQVSATYAIQAKTSDAQVCRCTRPPVPAGTPAASFPHWEGDGPPPDIDALTLSNRLPS